MKKLFTNQLFILFSLPVLIFVVLLFFITKDNLGFNRKIRWNIFDRYLGNPLYNFVVVTVTFFIFTLGYFVVYLMRRTTGFNKSLAHFALCICNLILFCICPEFFILIPLSLICFIIFIFNIFKTTKNTTTINKQPSTI